jgi:hypothetical protein
MVAAGIVDGERAGPRSPLHNLIRASAAPAAPPRATAGRAATGGRASSPWLGVLHWSTPVAPSTTSTARSLLHRRPVAPPRAARAWRTAAERLRGRSGVPHRGRAPCAVASLEDHAQRRRTCPRSKLPCTLVVGGEACRRRRWEHVIGVAGEMSGGGRPREDKVTSGHRL